MAPVPTPANEVNGTSANGSTNEREYDVIIVGAGFSGISALHRLRKDGLKAHIFETGK
jgi:cation diffusion facilitator CzcD-associated flavoprotein CzcO